MKNIKKLAACFLTLIILLALCGCEGSSNGVYRSIKELSEQSFCVAFRSKDDSAEAVLAAMKVMQANGKVKELSQKWFGRDVSFIEGDAEALSDLKEPPKSRTYNIGYDPGRLPFSGKDKYGAATGFDVELAKEVCALLNWKVKFIPIDVSHAEVELNSGNVDCVWGGFAYDAGYKEIDISPIYMENTVVLASLSDSKVRSTGSLSGKTLTLSENCYFNAVLEENSSLKNKPAIINRVPGGTASCIEALNSGGCDAIITDIYALFYYR